MENMLQRASAVGISGEGLKELCEMVTNFDDIFRLRLGPGPSAKIETMKVEVVANARSVRSKQWQYLPAKNVSLNRVFDKLQDYGFSKLTAVAE